MDDIDWEPDQGKQRVAVPNDFDLSSPEAFEAMLQRMNAKVRRQAETAGIVIDRLATFKAPNGSSWPENLDLARIGFFGWSFGGATAAEASIMDSRIVASVNMDGWLFGAASMGAQTKPSMTFLEDYPLPTPSMLRAREWSARYTP